MRLQLPLFPGRTNKHPPKYTNQKDLLPICTEEKPKIFLLVSSVLCWGIFCLESPLVTLALIRQFSVSLPTAAAQRLRASLMAVSMTMGRDTKWLTLEVCREFQRGTCSRSDAECKFAHPSRSCHVENGRVIACFDSLKVTVLQTRCSNTACLFPHIHCASCQASQWLLAL